MKICDRCEENHGVEEVYLHKMPPESETETYDLCERCRLSIKKYVLGGTL